MKTQSAKAKGRKLQQLVRDAILQKFDHLQPEDVRSTSMGAGGEDVLLSPLARQCFPFSVECKAQERLSLYPSFEQAVSNCGDYTPILVHKKNRKEPLVTLRFSDFMNLKIGSSICCALTSEQVEMES